MDLLCNICNKTYKTYQSLWNHNKKFHKELNIQIINDNKKDCQYKCSYCNMGFTRNNTMNNHMLNRCKRKLTIIEENNKLKKEMEILKKQIIAKPTNSTVNINNGIINNINNIIYINKTGTESLLDLTDKETSEIFNKEISGVVALIKFINFNERLPSNHSFCTKSLEGKYMLTYNTEESKIESTRKKYFYQEILSKAVEKMELLYKGCKNKFPKEKQTKIEDTIYRLNEIKDRDFSDKILKEIKNELIQLSYNCRFTVLNTWGNYKTEGKNADDIEQQFTDEQLAEFDSMFIENSSDDDSDVLNLQL